MLIFHSIFVCVCVCVCRILLCPEIWNKNELCLLACAMHMNNNCNHHYKRLHAFIAWYCRLIPYVIIRTHRIYNVVGSKHLMCHTVTTVSHTHTHTYLSVRPLPPLSLCTKYCRYYFHLIQLPHQVCFVAKICIFSLFFNLHRLLFIFFSFKWQFWFFFWLSFFF